MKFEIDKIGSETTYVARIVGLHPQYQLDRVFLEGNRRTVRAGKRLPGRIRLTYDLADGVYEIQGHTGRWYLAVICNRRTPVDSEHIETVRKRCKESGIAFQHVVNKWMASPKRSSESFAAIAKEMTAEQIASRKASTRDRQQREAAERKERVREMDATQAFKGSDSADTRGYLARLEKQGAGGKLAAALFRCQKASSRAKDYRRKYRDMSYNRKGKLLGDLCELLATGNDLIWGWRKDPYEEYAHWVLYLDLPQGQVSFHSPDRFSGPNYKNEWDGEHVSEDRILDFCDSMLLQEQVRSASVQSEESFQPE